MPCLPAFQVGALNLCQSFHWIQQTRWVGSGQSVTAFREGHHVHFLKETLLPGAVPFQSHQQRHVLNNCIFSPVLLLGERSQSSLQIHPIAQEYNQG